MKKLLLLFTVIILAMSLAACSDPLEYTNEPEDYKRTDGSQTVSYFPESIDEFKVLGYCYTSYHTLRGATEIYLNLDVTEDQYNDLLEKARSYSSVYDEHTALYDGEYTEIVYSDEYQMLDKSPLGEKYVGSANIQKVLFNGAHDRVVYE